MRKRPPPPYGADGPPPKGLGFKCHDKLSSKDAQALFKEYYKRGSPVWDDDWERKYQEWLDLLEEKGFVLAEGTR